MPQTNLQKQDTPMSLIHHRQLDGINSHYVFHWQEKKLEGCYLIKNQLTRPVTPKDGVKQDEILLLPGIFDPVRGEYGEDTITQLLNSPTISCVYELHYFSQEQSGLLNINALLDDLQFIFSHSSHLKVVGLSAGCVFTAVALFNLHENHIKPTLDNVLLLGPHIISYETLFYRWIKRTVSNPEMMAKVTRHAGHAHVPANVAIAESWCADTDFVKNVRTFPLRKERPGFPVKVEARYFRFDTLTRSGRKRLHWYFDCPAPEKPLSGLHRGLFRVPESSQIIYDFCTKSNN